MLADHTRTVDPARAHPRAGGGRRDPAHAHRAGAARAAGRRRGRQPGAAGTAAVAARARGALAARAARRAAGACSPSWPAWRGAAAHRRATPPPSRPACPHCWSSPTPSTAPPTRRRRGRRGHRRCCRCGARRAAGTSLDSEFELVLRLPGAADGPAGPRPRRRRAGGHRRAGIRRMVALPSVLRRCTVTAARLEDDDLCVVVHPRPRGVDPVTDAGTERCGRARRAQRGAARARPAPRWTGSSPLLRPAAQSTAGPLAPETCAVCPVCAVIAVLRGERPELAVRLADQAAGARRAAAGGAGGGGVASSGPDAPAGAHRPGGHGPR